MDYQVFLVRVTGGALGKLGGRGGVRILRVFDSCISVSNPSSYSGAPGCVEYLFENISNILPSTKHEHEVTINVPDRNERGYQTLHIFCECRSELITALLNKLDDLNGIGTDFSVRKHSHESGELAERVLRVRSASIVKMLSSGFRNERLRVNPAKKINFNDIVKVETLSDDEHIVLLYVKSRMLRLSLPDVQSFIMSLSRNMKFYLNRKLEVEKINTATMVENVAVYNKQAKELPYMYEFQATKHSLSRDQERNRTIYVSSEHFVEMAGDEVVAIHCLSDIIGLIVNDKNTNEVTVEFKSWRSTQYFVDERDDFIASMADVCRSSLFDIRPVPFFRHMLPHNSGNQFDYETYCINRLMSEFNGNRDPAVLHIILKEFASNVNVGRSQCSDYRVVSAMVELLKDWYSSEDFVRSTTCCIAISRLLGSRNCFEYMKSIPNLVSALLQCMSSGNAVLVYNASVTLRHAFKFSGNFQYSDTSILKQEQMNKFIVLRLENMQQFTTFLNTYSLDKDHILQAYGMVRLFAKGLENLSLDTEAGRAWIKAFESCVMTIADILCLLSRSKGTILRESTATLLEALLTKTSTLVSSHFRSLCLRRCLFIVHLNNSLFSKTDINQSRSARLIFHMMEGDEESKRLLKSLLPKGTFHLYDYIAAKNGKDKSTSYFRAWVMLLEALRRDTFETPLFIWNDLKRTELQKFLEQEIEGFNVMASSNPMVYYDIADVNLVYSPTSESEGTIVADVHLELLVDSHSPADEVYSSLWKLHDSLRLFQAVFQALVLGFTPFFGHNNIPEVDLRLAVEVLTWIYERHASDVNFSLQTSNVIEASVGMLQEVIHTEHQVFVFKLVVFLLTMMENGGRENVLRFVNAGGISALTSLLVLSLAQCCNNETLFESDMWYGGHMSPLETVQVTDSNGKVKLVRVPSGRVREVLDKALLSGSLDAKQAIKWQDEVVPSKIQFGLVLDALEALLRVSGCENKIECFPPPAVCIYLSREEVMCHLIQSLLRAKTPAFGRILSIISHVVRMNRPAMTQMVKLGTFEILLWKLAAGDIADADRRQIITFFKVWNIYQKDSCSCILDMYLPEGLALKLMSEDTDGFLTLVGSEENSPEVVWNNSMLETLVKHLSRQLEPYVRSRATDPMALYIRAPRTVHYEDLKDAVFSSPFYLHNLLDTERFPNYPINDPLKFLNNLMEESKELANDLKQSSSNGMSSSFWKKHISKIHLLLGSMAYLLERFVKLSHPHDIEAISLTLATPAVCSSTVEDFVVSDVIYQTTRVLKRIRITQPREGETLSGAVQFALSVLSLGTHLKPDGSFPEHISGQLELAIAGALIVLETTCESRVGRELLQKDLRWKSGLWWALCAAAGDAAALVPAGPSPVSFAALNCLKHYVNNEEAVYIFNQGLHLPLILLTFSSATRHASRYKTGLAYSAAEVLRSLASKDSNFLRNIIPEPLFKCLVDSEGPERFLTMQTSDFTEPKAIWNFHVREELRDSIYDRLCYHGAMMAANEIVEDDEVTWLQDFRYNSLSDELVLNGYYIRGLVNCNVDGVDFELQSELLNSLLVFLVEHKTDDKIVEDYLSVLTALEECITHAVNKNMESMLENSKLTETLSSIILQCMDTLHVHVQLGFARIAKKLIAGNMSHMVMESRLLEALTVQLWESAAEGREVVQCTLEALHLLSEQIPATIEATNCFSEHATLLPLIALFCNVHLPVLHSKRIPAASAPTCKEHRLIAAKVLGHILLTGKGVSRRAKLVEDLQRCKLQEVDEGITEATDMYELFSIVEQHEHAKSIRSLMLLLPLGILSALARDPEEACKIYDSSCSSPMLVWDETRREQVKSVIGNEAARVQDQVNDQGTYGLPAWSLDAKRPIFLCFTVSTTEGEEMKKPLYRREYGEEYAMELYLGGFYVDEFLRNYKYNFDPVLEQRFLHELRTALVIGTSTGGLYTEAFTFDDRRRLLLGLLLLWKLHTHLLTSRSNIDVVLPLYEIIRESGESRNERKALAQPAMMLLHCAATHPDIADCIVSEELIYSLSSIISLAVPYNYSLVNDVGTDPRLCSLSLLIRLLRLSNNAVDTVVRLGVMSKLEDLVLDFDVSTALKRKAAECLAIMCADKRKGNEVKAILEKLVPRNAKGYGSWKMPLSSIKDEIADMRTIEHFLRFRYPSPWWNSDNFTDDDTHNSRSSHSIVEASICFSRARLSDFNNEVETVFRRIIASMACVEVKAVQILRKRIAGSVFIDFEVNFQKPEGDMNGNLFKEKLERITREAFTNTLVEAMGAPKVTMVSLKRVEIPIEKKSITLHSSLDKNVIYVPQVPTGNSKTISPSQVHITPHTNGGSFIHLLSSPRTNSLPLSSNTETATHINIPPSKLDINSPSTPLTLPLKSHTGVHKVNGNPPPPPPLPPKPMYTNGASVHGNKVNGEVNGNPPPPPPLPPKPHTNGTVNRKVNGNPPPPPPLPPKPHTNGTVNGKVNGNPPPPPPLPPKPHTNGTASTLVELHTNGSEVNGSYANGTYKLRTNGTYTNGANVHGENGNGKHVNGLQEGVVTDGPLVDEPPVSGSNIMVKSEEGRLVPVEKGLELVLQGADISKENQQVARSNFLEAFEDEPKELGKMVEKYPKLVQKYPLQPQVCYDMVTAWEENCLNLLTADEMRKYGRSIAAFDMCRFDNPEVAVEEAKKKFQGILIIRREQEWKEKRKQLKGDMSAELAKAVGDRKEKVSAEIEKDELKTLSVGKIQKKKQSSP